MMILSSIYWELSWIITIHLGLRSKVLLWFLQPHGGAEVHRHHTSSAERSRCCPWDAGHFQDGFYVSLHPFQANLGWFTIGFTTDLRMDSSKYLKETHILSFFKKYHILGWYLTITYTTVTYTNNVWSFMARSEFTTLFCSSLRLSSVTQVQGRLIASWPCSSTGKWVDQRVGNLHTTCTVPSGKLTQLWKITIFNGKTH